MIIVIEQNAGNGNGNGLGMNAITRNTVRYTASGSRGKCLGWYSYVGKPTATTATTATNTTTKTATTEKPLTLKEIYEREKPEGYVPLFRDHDDPTPVTRGEVAIYGELARIRSGRKNKNQA